jgi:hypothetical protein
MKNICDLGSKLSRVVLLPLATVVLLGGITGCFTHRITVGNGGHNERYDSMQFFFVNGLIGTSDLNIRGICGSDNATVEIRMSLLNMLISGCTSGLITPMQATVYCGENKRAETTLSPDQQLALMHSDAFEAAVEENAPELLEDFRAARDVAPLPEDVQGF